MANSSISVTEGTGKNIASYSISEVTTKELQRTTLNTSAGVETGIAAAPLQVSLANTGANATAVKVDGSAATQPVNGTVAVSSITTSVVPGAAATNLGKAEDAVHASGDTGVYALGTRQDSPAATAGTSGDYQGAAYGANGAQWTTLTPSTVGGLSMYSGSVTNSPTSIKGSAGQLYGWYIYNPNATVAYVQIFDSGSISLGTTVPVLSLGIPPGAGANVFSDTGFPFTNNIAYAVTTTRTGSTAPSSSVDTNFFFK